MVLIFPIVLMVTMILMVLMVLPEDVWGLDWVKMVKEFIGE